MRLIAAGGTPPMDVNKYLLPHEQQVITVRRHPAVLLGPALLTLGGLTRTVAMMPLAKVTDMSFERSFWGRLFGYGDFILESAGQDEALRVVDHIPYPEQLYLEVCNLIFPSRDHGDLAGQP